MSWAALPVGPACIGKTCGGKRGVRSCSLDWLGMQIIENNDKVDGVNVYYDQIDEVVYLVKIILEEMEGKDHGESS